MSTEGTASVACVHCAQRTTYTPSQLHLSLHEGGVDDVVMLLRFTCPRCGRANAQLIVEQFAEALTDIGVPTTVVGSCPELEENLELRAGSQGRLTTGFVETFATMSIDSFNRMLARHVAEGMGRG